MKLQFLMYVGRQGRRTTTEYCILFLCSKLFFDVLPFVPVKPAMTNVNRPGKAIILMHDFQKHTGEALPTPRSRLKAGGYKVVGMKAKAPLRTLTRNISS